MAKILGTGVFWLERCMLAYGRLPKRPLTTGSLDDRLESLEADEPEETGPEDVQEPGARERVEHPERPRVLHLGIEQRPTPEPEY